MKMINIIYPHITMVLLKFKQKKIMPMPFKYKTLLFFSALLFLFSGCKKIFDLPEEQEFLSKNIDYKTKVLTPILGRTNLLSGSFTADNSTLPLQMEIVNMRFGDGRPAPDI